MADPRYGYYTPRAHAVVNGYDIAISGLRADYPLNGIPRCQIALPTGRSTRTNVPAAIHALGDEIGAQARIQVYAKFTPTLKSDQGISGLGLPEDDTIIFDGYTCGGGSSKGTSRVGFTLAANGGLVKMSQASALSDSSCVANPANYTYPALMRTAGDAGGNNPDGGDWTVATKANVFITQGNLQADLWGQAIYPWFKSLASQDGLWVNEPGLKVEGSNKQAESALKLIAPGGKQYKALSLRSSLQLDIDAATEIAKHIALLTHSASFTANQTLWDILIGHFAADYGFAVVSRGVDGVVVPYLGGYRGKDGPYKTVKAGEYDASDHQVARPRPLRAYGVLSSVLALAGSAGTDLAPNEALMGMGGWFDAGKDVDGSVLIEQAPGWLSATTSQSRAAAMSAGGLGKAIGSANNPGAATTNNKPRDAKKRAEELVKPLLDAYAKVRYAQEVLKGRSLVISGAKEQFLETDKLAADLMGDVQMVSLALDAEQPAAGTSFHIGNVRTVLENASDRSSVEEHPLFNETFLGCPLIDI
jgi:hypothetical protein